MEFLITTVCVLILSFCLELAAFLETGKEGLTASDKYQTSLKEIYDKWLREKSELFTQICAEKTSPVPEPCYDEETKMYIKLSRDWDVCSPIMLLVNSTELSDFENSEILSFLSSTRAFANDFANTYNLPLSMCDIDKFDPGSMNQLRFCVRKHILCARLNNS